MFHCYSPLVLETSTWIEKHSLRTTSSLLIDGLSMNLYELWFACIHRLASHSEKQAVQVWIINIVNSNHAISFEYKTLYPIHKFKTPNTHTSSPDALDVTHERGIICANWANYIAPTYFHFPPLWVYKIVTGTNGQTDSFAKINKLGEINFLKEIHLFLISAAIVINASSTLVAFFALVSRKGIPISSAKAYSISRFDSH
jgi:hypothetical protein